MYILKIKSISFFSTYYFFYNTILGLDRQGCYSAITSNWMCFDHPLNQKGPHVASRFLVIHPQRRRGVDAFAAYELGLCYNWSLPCRSFGDQSTRDFDGVSRDSSHRQAANKRWLPIHWVLSGPCDVLQRRERDGEACKRRVHWIRHLLCPSKRRCVDSERLYYAQPEGAHCLKMIFVK